VATFILIHGAGDVGWYWHLVEAELRVRGHRTVAPDLPAGNDSLTLLDYRDAVVDALQESAEQVSELVVVGQSFGAFTAPLVADRFKAAVLVLVAGMVPAPTEPPDDWWGNVGYAAAVAEQAARDGGLTGSDDPFVAFYSDVPRLLAEEAMSKERAHPSVAAGAAPWPLDAWPKVSTRSVVCTQDHFLPAGLQRRLAHDRLGVVPDEIDSGHCVALSRPVELADVLESYLTA
jgi:pimeloyl-ACP methyl ester carboxylesterase